MKIDSDYIIENIDFSLSMEDMPLTAQNKKEMKMCIDGRIDLDKLITETINKYKMEPA